jgi:hypothetical protein
VVVATPARVVGAFAAAAVELSAATPRFFDERNNPALFAGLRAKIDCVRRAGRSANDSGPEERRPSCAWLAFTCRS